MTADRRRRGRPPVCRIRAKVSAAAIMGAGYEQVTGVIATGACLPLKGFCSSGLNHDCVVRDDVDGSVVLEVHDATAHCLPVG